MFSGLQCLRLAPLALGVACRPGQAPDAESTEIDVDVAISEAIPTVVTVEWTSPQPTRSRVEFGADTNYGHTTNLEDVATTEHRHVLVGMKASTEVHLRVMDDGGKPGADRVTTTGALSGDLPSLEVQGSGQSGYVLTPLLGNVRGPVIIDADGDIVWYWLEDTSERLFQAFVSHDGQHVFYNALASEAAPGAGAIVRVALDGSATTRLEVPALSMDFVELADGTVGAIVLDTREVDGVPVIGDQLMEFTPDGDGRVVWSSWDDYDPATSGYRGDAAYWSHANALDHDPIADAWLMSLRNFGTIFAIDRASGDILWGLSGDGNDFDFGDPLTGFDVSHQFDYWGDGIIVFDNATPEGAPSKVVEYKLDIDARTAEKVWSYEADPEIYAYVLGDVVRLADGDTLVTWSVAGQIDRVTPEGEVTWRLNTGLGYAFGYSQYLEHL